MRSAPAAGSCRAARLPGRAPASADRGSRTGLALRAMQAAAACGSWDGWQARPVDLWMSWLAGLDGRAGGARGAGGVRRRGSCAGGGRARPRRSTRCGRPRRSGRRCRTLDARAERRRRSPRCGCAAGPGRGSATSPTTLLLTEDGLEQATRTVVADLRARRYADCRAPRTSPTSAAGSGSTPPRSPARACASRPSSATRSWRRWPAATSPRSASPTSSRSLDGRRHRRGVLAAALGRADAAYVDPARRDTADAARRPQRAASPTRARGRRRGRGSSASRPAFRARRRRSRRASTHALTPHGGCATWTSVDGQLVEAEIAWPALARDGVRRRAVVIRGDDRDPEHRARIDDLDDEPPPPVGAVGRVAARARRRRDPRRPRRRPRRAASAGGCSTRASPT